MAELSIGKHRGLTVLAGEDGRFRMLAVDQRGSMVRSLAAVLKRSNEQIGYEDLATMKAAITRYLSPYSTATLMDPVYGYPRSSRFVPRTVGILLATEETGYVPAGPDGRERLSREIEGWSVEKARRAGANAAKLLVYYHPDALTRKRQQNLVRTIGAACERVDLPFVLEVVGYSLEGHPPDSPAFAEQKPDIVIRSAWEFSDLIYKVDVLKLEFPASLKYCKGYARGRFDRKKRESVYNKEDIRTFCRRLDSVCRVPWVILSAGVDIGEFLENIKFACETGASGFLCGRAIWKTALEAYPDAEKMEAVLSGECAENFEACNRAVRMATPWFEHRLYRDGGIKLPQRETSWYREYPLIDKD